MEKPLRNILLFVFPFMLMVVVNHFIKLESDPIPNDGKLNTTEPLPDKCSWACHNNTIYCIEHHVKMNQLLLNLTIPFYFLEIALLKVVGNYSVANILILVTLIPIYIWYFLVRIIDTLQELKKVKK